MKKLTTSDFIKKSVLIHGDRYDYSKTSYKSARDDVCITCKVHGDFNQKAANHLNGNGCPACGGTNKLTTNIVVAALREIHGDKYDYSKVLFINSQKKIKIVCPVHGEFEQTYHSHKAGHGCPKCQYELLGQKNCHDFENFYQKAIKIHGDKYDYSKVKYNRSIDKITIVCPTHGEFYQRPDMHTNEGHGCPKCSCSLPSKQETQVFNLVQSIAPDAKQSVRSVIPPQELDIVVPSHKVAIEFNGIWWHSEKYRDNKYHLLKRQQTEKAGYRLISIREDLWNERRSQIENIICNALGVNSEKVYARKCTIVSVDKEIAATFLEQYHVQGFRNATHHCGLMLDGQLVAVMSVTHWKKKDEWELTRYATSCNVPGGLSRLWKHLVKTYEITRGYSYVDRDLFTGTSYVHAGFVHDSTTVGFRIVNGSTTESRQKWNTAPEGMTQSEWYEKEGVTRLYDSGQDKLVFTR